MKEIISHLTSPAQDYRLTCVNLVDSHHCSDPSKFISVCLTSLTAMLQISLPHVNLLSKVDLVERYGKLQFNLDYYTDVLDLEYMLQTLPDDNFTKKYKQLNEALTGLISDYSLVNFVPVTIKKKERLLQPVRSLTRPMVMCSAPGRRDPSRTSWVPPWGELTSNGPKLVT